MNNYTLLSIVVIVILNICIKDVSGITTETKPHYAQALCGDTFIKAWRLICKIKDTNKRRTGRSIKDLNVSSFLKRKYSSFILPNEAKQFLNPLHRKRRQISAGALDDATEECCLEKCTFGEIAEYKC